ncbi:hypothetical protein MRX96_018900 [Rhipicephalus microplus]
MGNKDYDASWYMCETKDSIRVLMVLYAFVTFLAMVAEATSTVVTAKNTDYHRRPYVWIMGATYTSLRFLTLIVIVYWIVAATNVSSPRSQRGPHDKPAVPTFGGMRMAFNIVFVRVIGNLVYNVAYFATDIFLIPDTLSRRYRMIIHPDMASRVISPAVPSPTTPRLRSGGDISRAASPAIVTSRPKGVEARPSEWVAPSRVGSPTRGYTPATRAAGSVAPSRMGSPTVAYAPAK